MLLKALTFHIIGTVFGAYEGLLQGVATLNARYGIAVAEAAFADGSLNGYASDVCDVYNGGPWVPPDQISLDATCANLPIAQLGGRADAAATDYFNLWRALLPGHDRSARLEPHNDL